MGAAPWWLRLSCVFGALAAPCRGINNCLDGITLNVILLDDAESPWGLQYVKGEVLKAIETDKGISDDEGNNRKTRNKATYGSLYTLYTLRLSSFKFCAKH